MKVTVQYEAVVYELIAGEFTCQHASTTPDELEHYDHYQEAVTGMPQPLSYERIDNCNSCTAYYSYWSEEWFDGGEV